MTEGQPSNTRETALRSTVGRGVDESNYIGSASRRFPVAAPEADIRRLGGPFVGLARCIDLGNFNGLVGRHFGGFAVPNSRNACVPRVDHGCEGDQLIYFAATILPCKPNRVVN